MSLITPEYYVYGNYGNVGGLAVAVPGTLMGLVHAYNKFGNNSWSSLVQPAIKIAENGFSIHRALAEAIEADEDIILHKKDNYPGMKYVIYVCMYVCMHMLYCVYCVLRVSVSDKCTTCNKASIWEHASKIVPQFTLTHTVFWDAWRIKFPQLSSHYRISK